MKKQFDLTKFETLENNTNDTLKGGFSQVISAIGGTTGSGEILAASGGNFICPIENKNSVAGCGATQ